MVWSRRARPFATGSSVSLSPERIAFASDVGAVLAVPGVSQALDEAAVATLLASGPPVLGERTCYQAVRRLPPGHTLTVDGASARCDRWWRPEDAPTPPARGDGALVEACLEICGRAVEDRMRGVRRVGAHLSGGLDSSSVAALAARARRRAGSPPTPAFSWQPPPGVSPAGAAEATEHALIEAVRRHAGLEVFYCPPTAADLLAYLRRDGTRDLNVHPNEEPVQRVAAGQGMRVLLSGWGGDEGISFNGRGRDAALLLEGRLVTLWRSMRARSRHPLAAILARVALPLVWPAAHRPLSRLRRGRSPRPRTFINPGFARRVRPLPTPPLPAVGVRAVQLHLLQLGHLAERMDGWATGGARHGIEYGYPLLDRRLLEFALGLSPEQYRRGSVSRRLMRQALGTLLPAEVCGHVDKRDPVRLGAFQDARDGALQTVREILEARPAPPRSAYLDMPRLMARLDPARRRADANTATIMRALRLLDF